MPANTLENKIAFVSGGSRGIGRSVALTLADAGAHVMISYRSAAQEARSVVDQIQQMGRESVAFQVDVSQFNLSREIVEKVVEQFKKLDILVNNAGITKDNLLMRMSEEDWDAVINTNLKSVFNMTKAAIRPMMAQRSGKIINITSIAGIIGNAGQANYAASKAGMIGFTKSLAKELGSRNIQVNAVAPGFVETDMTAKLSEEQRKKLVENIPLRRTAKPEEIAAAVKFLASAAADYITGQVICVDGGMVM
ncbi:MAG: 3-oxoacyl-[acyl-carrier-protein] reductase [Ignavibacteria bacterium]|nr:3-oxoacyl-[acyl-carrier-protein] reductase [Ignavibacteria bacterium]MBI3765952.1 3-oxoacyl-[acyl-carrier-protein] reductase [Ignavibacteriales bacterium]